MEHVTAKQAADLTGQSERTIRRWIKDGKLRARKIAPNRYEIAVSDLPPRKRSPMADLRARIDALEARIETLERANASVARSEPNLTVYSPIRTMTPILPAKTAGADLTRAPDVSFPVSIRGRAKWVNEHGGPGWTWVKDWPDVKHWNGPEDAIASVRKHGGWEYWSPTL